MFENIKDKYNRFGGITSTPNFHYESEFKSILPKENGIRNQLLLYKPLSKIRGVGIGNATTNKLAKLNLFSTKDLLYHFPRTYLDLSKVKKICDVKEGEEITIIGVVKRVDKSRTRSRKDLLKIYIWDKTGYITGIWFNQNYIADILKKGTFVAYSGVVKYKFNELQITNPLYDILDIKSERNQIHTGRIIPKHPSTAGISTKNLRRIFSKILSKYGVLPEPLPNKIKIRQDFLTSLSNCINQIHFPSSFSLLKISKDRLIYNELFFLQLGLALRKKSQTIDLKSVVMDVDKPKIEKFIKSLSFNLTAAQKKVINEIKEDISKPIPMNRLLQGDVGSGKTVVALISMIISSLNGYRSAIMVPTEVLAWQHYKNFKKMLKKYPFEVLLLSSSTLPNEKLKILKQIKEDGNQIIIGTHALIQERVIFSNLGLVIVDEQHRFGVAQRKQLKSKGKYPHVLIMSATPIPRTITQTMYGDLDVSIIDEMPPGRGSVETRLFHPGEREEAYNLIKSELNEGRQAFIICPLIEDSDLLKVKSVIKEAEELRQVVFKEYNVEILHGKLSSKKREEIMQRFENKELDVLISTTVVEVGIDVKNATVMLIENADRFGLSQLHQLRGRIRRGEHKSYCILFADLKTDEAFKRINAFLKTEDGFELANKDLEIRGEGEIFGERQWGIPDLKISSIVRDKEILEKSRKDAFSIIKNDISLSSPITKVLINFLNFEYPENKFWQI
ncbi:MAG: ATP-dependent DNA helicase RecG [Candidatus Humimicrobiia bacterium]